MAAVGGGEIDATLADFADLAPGEDNNLLRTLMPESQFKQLLEDVIENPVAPATVAPTNQGGNQQQQEQERSLLLPIHLRPGSSSNMGRTLRAKQHLQTMGEQRSEDSDSDQEEQQRGSPPRLAADAHVAAPTAVYESLQLDLAPAPLDGIPIVVVPEEGEIVVADQFQFQLNYNPPNIVQHYVPPVQQQQQQQQVYVGGCVVSNLANLQNLPPPAKQMRMDSVVQHYQPPANLMYASAPGPSAPLPEYQVNPELVYTSPPLRRLDGAPPQAFQVKQEVKYVKQEVKYVPPAGPSASPHFVVGAPSPVQHLVKPLPRESLHKVSPSPSSSSSGKPSPALSDDGQKSNLKRTKLPKPEKLGEDPVPILLNVVDSHGQPRTGFQCGDCLKCFVDTRCHNKHHRDIHRLYKCEVLGCMEVRAGYSRYNDHVKKAHGHVPKKIATRKDKAK